MVELRINTKVKSNEANIHFTPIPDNCQSRHIEVERERVVFTQFVVNTQFIVLHTVCNFTQCVISHKVCNFTQSV